MGAQVGEVLCQAYPGALIARQVENCTSYALCTRSYRPDHVDVNKEAETAPSHAKYRTGPFDGRSTLCG